MKSGFALALITTFGIFNSFFGELESFERNPVPIQQIQDNNQEESEIPTMSLYKDFLKKAPVNNEVLHYRVNDYESYKSAYYDIYEKLPAKAMIDVKLDKNRDEFFKNLIKDSISVRTLPNYHLNANYSVKKIGSRYIFTDNTHPEYQAFQIETAIKQFSEQFAKSIEHYSSIEKFNIIYDYVYSQFKYNSSSYQKMLIGNAYNYEMACNGFSKLMYELLNGSGIETIVVQGEDHIYNHVKTSALIEDASEDDWFILDVTTDILLQEKHGATGKSQEDYLSYVNNVGFYFATPTKKETSVATPLTENQRNEIVSPFYFHF